MLNRLHSLVENLGKSLESLSQWDDSKRAAEACAIIAELVSKEEQAKSAISATIAEAVQAGVDKALTHV